MKEREERTLKLVDDMLQGRKIDWREVHLKGVDAELVMRTLRNLSYLGKYGSPHRLCWKGHPVTKLEWTNEIDNPDAWDEDRYYTFTVPGRAGDVLGCPCCGDGFTTSATFQEYAATLRGGGLSLLMALSVE